MADSHAPSVPQDHSYIDDFVRVRDEVARLHGWRHEPDDVWCYVLPPGQLVPPQGWKIHLSATPRSAVEVLGAAARVLLRRQVSFKFAKGLSELRMLLSIRCDRGAGGKFITVYPDDTEQFVELLDELHQATEGMEGPAILSDRRYRPGSLVHYRYGGFSGSQEILEADGSYVPMLVTPPGGWEQDNRLAWYAPPEWAPLPMADAALEPRAAGRGTLKVMLDDRFVVHEAIRHSNRGGVYRAHDKVTGGRVIVKEARPFVSAELDGTDARDFLRNEHDILRLLEPLRIAARPVALFEYQGHTFLAEEEVPGQTLRDWTEELVRAIPDRVVPLGRALPLARKLLDLVAAVHDKGFVFRDFTSNNVMVTPDEDLVIIDTEFVAVPGQQVTRVMTVSYTAPEELSGPPRHPAPPLSADLYSVGATLFYLCTGLHPVVPQDEPADKPWGEPTGTPRPLDGRIERLVRAVSADNPTLRALAPIVLGLMREDPERRLRLHQAREMLDALGRPSLAPAPGGPMRLSAEEQRRLLEDARAHLVAAMTPDDARHLWPATPLDGRIFDPLSLQAGAAGAVEVLRRGFRETGDDGLRTALATAVRWLDRRLDGGGRALPGLYFGRAGTHWALYEAAAELGDDQLMARTLRRVKHLPVKWNNPDITHGVAGGGLAQLHLWRRTGDEELRERVLLCVESVLVARATRSVVWPLPDGPIVKSGGMTHYGFAHGVAGICAFLLAAARELDRPDLLETAVDGGDFLVSLARPFGDGAQWPVAQKEAEGSARYDGVCWWCSGAPGIATFLIRLWRATGEQRYLDAAERAAVATRAEKWRLSASHCHGLAGNGEFLLDMAAATGRAEYRDWAEEYADALSLRSALRRGRLVPLDDGVALSYSYNIGLSGPIGFLHRLRHGGERWWMVDDFTLAPGDDR